MKLLRNLTSQAKRLSGTLPLRILLVVPFVVQVFGVVALTGWLSLRNGQKAVNDVATALRKETSARIQQHLDTYLESPHLVNQINADAMILGLLNLQDKTRLQRYLWKQSLAFKSVSDGALGTETGEYIAFDRQDDGSIQLRISDNSTGSNLYKYATDSQSDRAKLLTITPNYEPRIRPWYKSGVQAGKPHWSEIYSYFATQKLVITQSQPWLQI